MNTLIHTSGKKGLAVAALAGTLLFLFGIVRFAAAQGNTFNGEITDEHLNCVQTPMKATEGIKTKDACVLYWAHSVQPNSKYVLYDAATKTAYQLDDQDAVQPYVGEKVQVTGTLNAATKTIKVTGVKVP
jgi:hypothetical protein